VTGHSRRQWRRRKAEKEEDVQRRAFRYFQSSDRDNPAKAGKAADWYPMAANGKPHLGLAPVLRRGLAAGAAAGGLVHVVVSLGWGTVLAVAVRRTPLPPVVIGVAAGAAIAAFGAVAGAVLARRG
jgi:hypothetical protein